MKPSAQIKLIETTITDLHACQTSLPLSTATSKEIDTLLRDLRIERQLAQSKLGNHRSIVDHILSWQ
jgi:hypothetical protein